MFTIEAQDGSPTMIVGEGSLMGSSEAPLQFLAVHKDSLVEHNQSMHEHFAPCRLRCRITNRLHDGSLSTFADDVARKVTFAETETIEHRLEKLHVISSDLGTKSEREDTHSTRTRRSSCPRC